MIGTIYSTNITPDPETGIGAWRDEDFIGRCIRDRQGRQIPLSAFPYTSYALMTDNDVLAIKAYLLTLKPVRYTPPPNDISFPFNQRYLMMFWNALLSRRIASGRMRYRPIGIAAPISSRRSAIAAIVTRLATSCLD